MFPPCSKQEQIPLKERVPLEKLIALEDLDSHTPILTAAANSKLKAFQCLMSYQPEHLKEKPVFKALESKGNPVAILKVQSCTISIFLHTIALCIFPVFIVDD